MPTERPQINNQHSPYRNQLQFEKSPYLLQHAANPVKWYPWGDAAFERARSEDKPIFLSIGYATCHWCHVMAQESFEDTEVARLMNETFVSIKVDREERPDIDSVYMAACQMMTGSGGWPLTILMTPGKKPFFAATYVPRSNRYGRIGMLELVPKIKELWEQHRDEIFKTSNSLAAALTPEARYTTSAIMGPSLLDRAFTELAHRFDETHGGFGDAPKFPVPHQLMFLLRFWKRTGNARALTMVTKTLDAMRRGGIYDHIGFGFHRYATDARWLVPHFEKMLYDQALLALAYTEAFQVTGEPSYRETVQEILTFVIREMTSSEGAFYAAVDADTEGEEGKTYLWTLDELREVLGSGANRFAQVFEITGEGNFAAESTGMKHGHNIPHLARTWREMAQQLGMNETSLRSIIEDDRQKLLLARRSRIQPNVDDKVLVDWNGLMIAAFARAGKVFGNSGFTTSALHAADFILQNLRTKEGRLFHRYRDGEAGIAGFLDDYAFFIWGLIELYGATLDTRHLREGLALNAHLLSHFWDDADGGFFISADDGEELLVRRKEVYDGAIPSGNSVAMLNLAWLAGITADTGFPQKAECIAKAFGEQVLRAPSAHSFLMIAHDFLVGPSLEVVIVGRRDADDTRVMSDALASRFMPNAVVFFCDRSSPLALEEDFALCNNRTCIDGKATAYVCRDHTCCPPVTDISKMVALLPS